MVSSREGRLGEAAQGMEETDKRGTRSMTRHASAALLERTALCDKSRQKADNEAATGAAIG